VTSTPSSDLLAARLGTDIAAEMREWARQTLRKQVRLADPPWVRSGNTGAVLAVVELVPDVEPRGYLPSEDRLIVKVYPQGDLAAETGNHTLATEVDRDFAERHLVPQKHSRLPLKDGRFFSFQEIVFDLSEAYPLTQVTRERQPMVAARAAELVLVEWNKTEQKCRTRKRSARSYLLDELRGALESDHGTYAWAKRVGLLDPAAPRIRIAGDDPTRTLPNPVALASDTSLLGTTALTTSWRESRLTAIRSSRRPGWSTWPPSSPRRRCHATSRLSSSPWSGRRFERRCGRVRTRSSSSSC
jgi:hypothetical protein